MPTGTGLSWLLTWSLWGIVVDLDRRRDPRDWRWMVSLVALAAIALATRDMPSEFRLRFHLLSGLAAMVILGWGVSEWRSRRRLAGFAAWARSHGFEPVALAPCPSEGALPDGLRRLPIFANGTLSRSEAVLIRKDGDAGSSLVFRQAIRRGRPAGEEVRGTFVAIRRTGSRLPRFAIRPDGLPWRLDGGTFGEPVPVTRGSRFGSTYRLSGPDPRDVIALFPDDALEDLAARSGWVIQGEGEWLSAAVCERPEGLLSLKTSSLRIVEVGELDEFVREAHDLLDRLARAASRRSARDVGAA